MANPRRSNGSRRDSLRARVIARGEACWICGHPVDSSLPNLHPWQLVIDELTPVSRGGSPYDPENCVAAHRCCNNWRKAKPVTSILRVRALVDCRLGGSVDPTDFVAKARVASRDPSAGPTMAPPRTTTEW